MGIEGAWSAPAATFPDSGSPLSNAGQGGICVAGTTISLSLGVMALRLCWVCSLVVVSSLVASV